MIHKLFTLPEKLLLPERGLVCSEERGCRTGEDTSVPKKMPRTCCCCIPVLGGATVIGLIATLLSLAYMAPLVAYRAQIDPEVFNPIEANIKHLEWGLENGFKVLYCNVTHTKFYHIHGLCQSFFSSTFSGNFKQCLDKLSLKVDSFLWEFDHLFEF